MDLRGYLQECADSGTLDISTMQGAVLEINTSNGWFSSDRSFGDDIALLHSEVSEAFEAYRINGNCEDQTTESDQECWNGNEHDPRICKWGVQPGPCREKFPKPEGVGSEFADILIRLLDSCERFDIDLEGEFLRKLNYNSTRGYRHGNKFI